MKAHFLISLLFITIPMICSEKKVNNRITIDKREINTIEDPHIKGSEWAEWAITRYPEEQTQLWNDVDHTRHLTLAFWNRRWLEKARAQADQKVEEK